MGIVDNFHLPTMAAMKAAMKAKVMKVSKIAKGKRSRNAVFSGKKEKTGSGMTKADLVKSKTGKIVSKKASARAKKAFQGSVLQKWSKAVQAARKALGVKGFVAVKKGTPLYNKAKALL